MDRRTEWLNSNRYRRYPFVENCAVIAASSTKKLPDSCILDLSLTDYEHAADTLELRQVEISHAGTPTATFTFTLVAAAVDIVVVAPLTAATPYWSTTLGADCSLRVIFGEGLAELDSWPDGVVAGVMPVEPALLEFQLNNRLDSVGDGQHAPLDGDLYFEEGYNCSIAILGNTVRISAVKGAGAGVDCTPFDTSTPACNEILLYLNGMRGSDMGEFLLQAGKQVEVAADPANHIVTIRAAVPSKDELICGDA